jgi:hypothetical protein
MSGLGHGLVLIAAVLGGLVVCLVALDRLERWLDRGEQVANRSSDDERSED